MRTRSLQRFSIIPIPRMILMRRILRIRRTIPIRLIIPALNDFSA